MHRRLLASLGIPLSALLLLLPQVVDASHPLRTVCNRQFLTLPESPTDPFGYRYTEPLSIPGIGNQRRIAECDYIGGGGGPPFAPDGATRGRGGGGRGGQGGDGIGEGGGGGLRRRGPRFDRTAYSADLLREREERRRRKSEVPRDREEELPVPSLVPSFMEEEPHDSDCDGFDNLEELFLGTDPLDPEDPSVEEGVRRRTVSLDPTHPCYATIGEAVMPKTGWDRGEWFFPEPLHHGRAVPSPWFFIGSAIACVGWFLTLLCRRHAAEE